MKIQRMSRKMKLCNNSVCRLYLSYNISRQQCAGGASFYLSFQCEYPSDIKSNRILVLYR